MLFILLVLSYISSLGIPAVSGKKTWGVHATKLESKILESNDSRSYQKSSSHRSRYCALENNTVLSILFKFKMFVLN